ncbi:hypothetical protein FACS18947_6120 [Bacteroidia bacterium]|nr:hypothetical protein FACS18947_6120 [Bacteroidia bacterium]
MKNIKSQIAKKITAVISVFMSMSLITKFVLAFIMLLILPLFCFGIYFYKSFYNDMLRQYEQSMTWQMDDMNTVIQSAKNDVEKAVFQLEYANDFPFFVNPKHDTRGKEWEHIVKNFTLAKISLKNANPDLFYKIKIYSHAFPADKEVYDAIYDIERLIDTEQYETVMNSKEDGVWVKNWTVEDFNDVKGYNFGKRNAISAISYFKKIRNLNTKEVEGILEVDVLVTVVLSRKTNELGKEYSILFFDKNGDTILQQNAVDLSKILTQHDGNNKEGFVDITIEGNTYHVLFREFDEIGVTAVIGMEQTMFLNELRGRQTDIMIILIVVFIGTSSLIVLLVKRLFSRFQLLTTGMSKLKLGDLDTRIKVSGNDEISALASGFNEMATLLKSTLVNVVEKETAQKEAELRALQLQINPHFIYNTLENFRMECEIGGNYELADAIVSLGDFLRYNIKRDNDSITLGIEIANIENYLEVMRMRHKDKLNYINEVDEKYYDRPLLKTVLQPFIENCFSHAFIDRPAPWVIRMHAMERNGRFEIEISDNGNGMKPDMMDYINDSLRNDVNIVRQSSVSTSIGITNVNRRIKIKFGNAYGVCFESSYGYGTTAIISLPGNRVEG